MKKPHAEALFHMIRELVEKEGVHLLNPDDVPPELYTVSPVSRGTSWNHPDVDWARRFQIEALAKAIMQIVDPGTAMAIKLMRQIIALREKIVQRRDVAEVDQALQRLASRLRG